MSGVSSNHRDGEVAQGKMLLESMTRSGRLYPPDLQSFNVLIGGICDQERAEAKDMYCKWFGDVW